MPYEPNMPSESDKANAYTYSWAGFAATPVALAAHLLDISNMLTIICFGAAIGGYLSSVLSSRTDEYFQALAKMGHRFVAGFVCVYLLAMFFITDIADAAFSIGYMVTAGEEPVRRTTGLFGELLDAKLLGLSILFAYYSGFAFARLRG